MDYSTASELSLLQAIVIEDSEPIEVPVKIKTKKGLRSYILREASEDAAVKFKNTLVRGARMSGGQVTGIDGIADAEIKLISMCLVELFPVSQGGQMVEKERPVPEGELKSWNHRTVKPLFERLKKISELDDQETAEVLRKRIAEDTLKLERLTNQGTSGSEGPAKNGQSDTTTT